MQNASLVSTETPTSKMWIWMSLRGNEVTDNQIELKKQCKFCHVAPNKPFEYLSFFKVHYLILIQPSAVFMCVWKVYHSNKNLTKHPIKHMNTLINPVRFCMTDTLRHCILLLYIIEMANENFYQHKPPLIERHC